MTKKSTGLLESSKSPKVSGEKVIIQKNDENFQRCESNMIDSSELLPITQNQSEDRKLRGEDIKLALEK